MEHREGENRGASRLEEDRGPDLRFDSLALLYLIHPEDDLCGDHCKIFTENS